jgi:hypothetical protein
MASYKERMENLAELNKSYNFTPEQYYKMASYKVGETGRSMVGADRGRGAATAQKDEAVRKRRIVDYLKKAKESAIKRGVYNQKVFDQITAEAGNYV